VCVANVLITQAIKDVDDAAAVVSTSQSARPSQRRQGRDEPDHARDAPVHALPERRCVYSYIHPYIHTYIRIYVFLK